MKKSNWIGLAIAVLVDVFLLWLWFFLGFNRIDSPLDLVIFIIWLVVIVAVIVGVNRLERQREKRLRTIYVSSSAVFNKERGLVSLGSAAAPPPASLIIRSPWTAKCCRRQIPRAFSAWKTADRP